MRLPREKLPELIEAARRAAEAEQRIVFAYLFGSAVEEGLITIGDLDVAVYASGGDFFKIAADLGTIFAKLTGLPGAFLDVRDLKEAPPSAAMKILKTGRLLFCRDPLEHAEFIERLSNEYRLLTLYSDEEILLARLKGEVVESYVGLIERAERAELLPPDVLRPLKPFFRFRNALIHRYWEIDDRRFISHSREGLDDFRRFVGAIEERTNLSLLRKQNRPALPRLYAASSILT